MNITDKQIAQMEPKVLLSVEVLDSLFRIRDKAERARLQGIMEYRAKEFGMASQFKSVIKAYQAIEKQLAVEFAKEAAQETGIELACDGQGKALSTVDNFLKVIEADPKFSGLKFNLLTYSPEQVRDGKVEKWTDADDAEARRYIEKAYHIHSVQKCDDAFRIMFKRNEYHPIRDIVDALQWDGVPRIEQFLHRWTKCEDTPYTREVSRLIFAGGIHRLYNPGCKFDDMPVLIGKRQGEGKSTLVRWLAMRDEYFTECNEFDGQRGIEAVEGAWICEVSELLAMTKAREMEAVKSYLTRLNDRYRMPFDKRVTDHPRQCVFIGTTNKEQFLTDKTGNRRFYPVVVRQSGYDLFDHEAECRAYIEQCWAEAKALFDADQIKPYANRDLLDTIRQHQDEAAEDDYRVGLISDYLATHTEVCILELWKCALKMNEYSKPTKKDSNDISTILQSMDGWQKSNKPKRFPDYGVQKYWFKSEPTWADEVADMDEDDLLPL